MREKILKLIEEKPKHFSKIIKNTPELKQWVDQQSLISSDNYAACIRSAVYQESNVCQLGNIKKFAGINQGFTSDRMLTLGAFYQNKLVAVLSLDFKSKIIEVVRYATIINENYPGLFSKMLSKCINYIPNDVSKTVITISDNRHSNGNLYIKSGFTMVKSIKPEYYYTKNYHLIERKKRFTKAKIQKKFNIDIKNKTEWELMQELNYDRIWDAGKIYWKLNI